MANPELTLRYARGEQSEEKKKADEAFFFFFTLIVVGSWLRVVSSEGEISFVMEIMQTFWMVKFKKTL